MSFWKNKTFKEHRSYSLAKTDFSTMGCLHIMIAKFEIPWIKCFQNGLEEVAFLPGQLYPQA